MAASALLAGAFAFVAACSTHARHAVRALTSRSVAAVTLPAVHVDPPPAVPPGGSPTPPAAPPGLSSGPAVVVSGGS